MSSRQVYLDAQPRHAYIFLWADYVELLCLFSRNGYIARGALQEIMQEAGDVQIDALATDGSDADTDDAISQRWADISGRLTSRQKSWPSWPFRFENGVLTNHFQPKSVAHNIYVSLLFASSLHLVSKPTVSRLADHFEHISRYWLKQSLTTRWTVKSFGASSGDYTGTLYQKLQKLAIDIRGRLMKDKADYNSKNTGDAGIDLVAWMDMKDQRGNMPVIFGQCACSPVSWEDKQLSVTPGAIEAHIRPQHPGASYCFIPHDLRASDKVWDRSEHVLRTVLVDRGRFLDLLCHQYDRSGRLKTARDFMGYYPLIWELLYSD